jgi:tetratricopeptide (TPR) repeat protein
VILGLPTPAVGDLIGKTRELWRLGRLLYQKQQSNPVSLHLFAESIRIGVRWLMVGEGPKYYSDIYNKYHELPSVDKLDLAVFGSWSQWWMISTCLSVLQQQVQAEKLAREVIGQRIGEIKALQVKFEHAMKSAVETESPAVKERPEQAAVVWLALSVYYSHIRNDVNDLSCARRAVACDSRNSDAALRLANSLLEHKERQEARKYYAEALTLLTEASTFCSFSRFANRWKSGFSRANDGSFGLGSVRFG